MGLRSGCSGWEAGKWQAPSQSNGSWRRQPESSGWSFTMKLEVIQYVSAHRAANSYSLFSQKRDSISCFFTSCKTLIGVGVRFGALDLGLISYGKLFHSAKINKYIISNWKIACFTNSFLPAGIFNTSNLARKNSIRYLTP
jgi:hypothetical protein